MANSHFTRSVLLLVFLSFSAHAEVRLGAAILGVETDKMPNKHYHFEGGGFLTEWDMQSVGYKAFVEADLWGPVDVRLSAGTLGKYKVYAAVNGDNDTEDLIDAVGMAAANSKESDMSFTTSGATKFLSFTAIFNYKRMYFEAGPTCYQTEQQIQIAKQSTGFTMEWKKDRQSGCGYVASIGGHVGKWTISLERYDIGAGHKSSDNEYKHTANHIDATGNRPSGVNGATAISFARSFNL